MRRLLYQFENIPSMSNIFWNIPLYKNNTLEYNKQICLNYGKYNSPNSLGFMSNTRFKQGFIKQDMYTHSWLNMVGNLNQTRFKVYESCYFQKNTKNGYIDFDYSLLWLDVITNEPFYSPVSQEVSTRMKDKVNITLNLKYDIRQNDKPNTEYDNTISDDLWTLLSQPTQDKLSLIREKLIENREKSIVTD